jgi:hypothetical protein
MDSRAFVIESVTFLERLDGVEWWARPTTRDYFHVVLRGEGIQEAVVFVDRETNERFVQGFYD